MSSRPTRGWVVPGNTIAWTTIVLTACLMSAIAAAQDDPDATHETQVTATDDAAPEEPHVASERVGDAKRQQHLVSILMMMLAGIGIVGVAMISTAMIWGARLRRIARHTDHPPTQQDELWYMRRPPPEDVDPAIGPDDAVPPSPEDTPPTSDRETAT